MPTTKLKTQAHHAVEWFSTPQTIPLDSLKQNFISLIFLTAIVNPFGPTMKGLAVLSKAPLPASPTELQIARFQLNPFSHAVEVIGLLDPSSTTMQLPRELINNIGRLGYDGSGCFTLFHPGYSFSNNQTASQLARALLLRVNGLVKELSFLKRFPNDPWRRISAEVDDADQPLRDIPAGRPQITGTDSEDRHPTSAEVESFVQTIQPEEHYGEELKAFFAAWKGAIENVAPGTLPEVMTVDTIIDIYANLVQEDRPKKSKRHNRTSKR